MSLHLFNIISIILRQKNY